MGGIALAFVATVSCRPLPYVTPTSIHPGRGDVLYLFDRPRETVFAYSMATRRYVAEFPLGERPDAVTYVPDHNALYVRYAFGPVEQIDLDASDPHRQPFSAAPFSATAIGAAGPFLVVGNTNSFRTYRKDGSLAGQQASLALSWFGEGAWDPVRHRFYRYLALSPLDLAWSVIDPATGAIGSGAATPYHGDFSFGNAIRVAKDGADVLSGNRLRFDANTLEVREALPVDAVDTLWLDAGERITLSREGSDATRLDHWDAAHRILDSEIFRGRPLRVFERETPGTFAVVTEGRWRPRFRTHVPSSDRDGDGVANATDAFPHDAAAASDTDRDGHPDAWNPGFDPESGATELTLDAFPLDSACWQHDPGGGGACDIERAVPAYAPAAIARGTDDVAYLLSPAHDRIFRWSLGEGRALNPIVLRPGASLMAYAGASHRLYVGYRATDSITVIDLAQSTAERPFTGVVGDLVGLATAGPFVLASDTSKDGAHYTFGASGGRISWESRLFAVPPYEWSPATNRMYYFRSPAAGTVEWDAIDPASGAITTSTNGTSVRIGPLLAPLRPSRDGARVLLGTGVLRQGRTLALAGSLPVDPVDAMWLANGGLLTIRASDIGDTIVEQWTSALSLVTQRLVQGAPLRVLESSTGLFVVSSIAGRPVFHAHALGSDGDGDGVPSPVDAFPLDPAASADTDFDGSPDAWNPGRSEADSTTGLELDAHPQDSACTRAEPGVGGVCDVAGAIPAYDPVDAAIDTGGVVYLFSPEHERIYRWSTLTARHLNPIAIARGAIDMSYSSATHRLTLAYPNGALTRIDLAISPAETGFSATYTAAEQLAAAGEYVIAVHAGNGSAPHYSFAPSGALVSFDSSNFNSRAFGWSPVNRRLYYFGDSTSSAPMLSEEISPTGVIRNRIEGEHYSGRPLVPPILPAADGSRVVIGSGQFYDGATLAARERVDAFVDGFWMPDGSLVALRAEGVGASRVVLHGADRVAIQSALFPGAPRRILPWADGAVVVTLEGGRPVFHRWTPLDDADGDGVTDDDDAFPTDPAASVDGDGDGAPDAWNPGRGAGDTTTGLVLDAHPADFACQLASHGIGGACDFRRVIPRDAALPLCAGDEVDALPPTGSLATAPSTGFVALCHGWILYGDRDGYSIVVRELGSGRVGLEVPLPSKPSLLELDADRKRVYVASYYVSTLMVVDLTTKAVRTIALPDYASQLALGNDGDLWLTLGPSYAAVIRRLPGSGAPLMGGWSAAGEHRIVFNRTRSELITGRLDEATSLTRYTWNGSVLTERETNSPGYRGSDLAVSADGQRVAFAPDSDGGTPAATEWLASDVRTRIGRYPLDAASRALAYAPSSDRIAIATNGALSIWDTASRTAIVSTPIPSCSDAVTRQVGYSLGGRFAVARQDCGRGFTSTRFHWLRTD